MQTKKSSVNLNLESSLLKVVQESVVQAFKQHKKYIEKEITLIVNQITLLKKENKSQK